MEYLQFTLCLISDSLCWLTIGILNVPYTSTNTLLSYLSLEAKLATNPCKTPIQQLHGFGTKTGNPPVYTLIKAEGEVHNPSFTFRLVIGDIVSSGMFFKQESHKTKSC
ncbi:hypothetical protein XENTR_v10024545 [Xenopus tropicalis]|nr:hypothetical protein XENTR_v10024545 [Xenopus tropicalis]